MRLYPRLNRYDAERVANDVRAATVEHARRVSAFRHAGQTYRSTGGARAGEKELLEVADALRDAAGRSGYPDTASEEHRLAFDRDASVRLHRLLNLSLNEASCGDVWRFMACVLVPDIVRWRYWAEETALERFSAQEGKPWRNCLSRLWIRAESFSGVGDEWLRLGLSLSEREFTDFIERPGLASSPRVLRASCRAYRTACAGMGASARDVVRRDGLKFVMRLLPMVELEVLAEPELEAALGEPFEWVRSRLG